MSQPYHECPSFDKCSANACPLDPDYPSLEKVRLSGEEKCRAWKPTRQKIAQKYPELKYKGLFMREFQGKARWEALSLKERELSVGRLAKFKSPSNSGIVERT